MAQAKVIPFNRYQDAQETIRELRFKLKAFAALLEFAKTQLPEATNGEINVALFGLLQHTRGEKPLRFHFQNQTIEEP
jgi:hypothetical protein